jgi:hypothetical protein
VFIEREDSSCLSRRCLNSGGRTVKRERNPDRHAAITGAWIKVSLWRPKLRRFGKPPGLHSIKMVASVVADQQGAITFHHTISRLSLIILGLRLRRATWRNEGVGIARLMTVVCKNSGARELWRLHRCLTNFLIMKRNGRSATNFIASAGAISRPGSPMETREILLKADRIVVALERLEDGKTRATTTTWDDAKVISPN